MTGVIAQAETRVEKLKFNSVVNSIITAARLRLRSARHTLMSLSQRFRVRALSKASEALHGNHDHDAADIKLQ